MSAANFCVLNAKNYFVTEEPADDLCLDSFVHLHGWGRCAWNDYEKNISLWRSYPGRNILRKDFSIALPGGRAFHLEAAIVHRSGYYSGAVLDYELNAGIDTGKLSDFDDSDDFAAAIVEGILWDLERFENWNDGLCAIFRGRFLEAVKKGLAEVSEKCNDVCSCLCDNRYKCVGVFSNGAAIYKLAY